VWRYLKTEYLKQPRVITATFECPAPAKSVMWKFMKQSRQTGNLNIPKRVPRSTVVTWTRIAKVSKKNWVKSAQANAETSTRNWNILQ
jgi:hypothetical protein